MDKTHCTVKEFCAANSIGKSRFYEQVKAGRIAVVKWGTRTLIPIPTTLPLDAPSVPTDKPTDDARILAASRGQRRTAKGKKSRQNGGF